MTRWVKAARNAGLADGEIAEVLNLSGISKSDVRAILSEHVPPYRLNRATIQNIVRTALTIYGKEVADQIMARVGVVEDAAAEYEKRQGIGR